MPRLVLNDWFSVFKLLGLKIGSIIWMFLSYLEIEQKASKRARVHGSRRVYRNVVLHRGSLSHADREFTEEHGLIFQICPQVEKTWGEEKKMQFGQKRQTKLRTYDMVYDLSGIVCIFPVLSKPPWLQRCGHWIWGKEENTKFQRPWDRGQTNGNDFFNGATIFLDNLDRASPIPRCTFCPENLEEVQSLNYWSRGGPVSFPF